MEGKKGFTLIEMTVVLVIVGIAAAFIIPNLIASSEQTKAQVARNNLYAISAAQQKYFEDHSSYCLVGCGDTTANINANFHLSISDSFNYQCSATLLTIPYQCTAGDGTDNLTLNPNAVSPSNPVSCAGPAGYCPP